MELLDIKCHGGLVDRTYYKSKDKNEIRAREEMTRKLNKKKDNVIWVCHALTANTDVPDWWNGLFGENHLLDLEKYFIICGPEFGLEKVGKRAKTVRALYGGKCAGLASCSKCDGRNGLYIL